MSHATPKSAFCPCCKVCCDSNFILLVKEVLLVRALNSCLRSPASHIVCVSLVVAAGVPSFSLPVLMSHIAWSSAPVPIILEVSSSHLS